MSRMRDSASTRDDIWRQRIGVRISLMRAMNVLGTAIALTSYLEQRATDLLVLSRCFDRAPVLD